MEEQAMTEQAIFTPSDEHEILADFILGDGDGLDVLGLVYRKLDRQLEANFRQRYFSGRKDSD